MSMLCALHLDYSVFEVSHHSLLSTCVQVRRGEVESLYVDCTLVQSCGAMGAGIMKSTIEQKWHVGMVASEGL